MADISIDFKKPTPLARKQPHRAGPKRFKLKICLTRQMFDTLFAVVAKVKLSCLGYVEETVVTECGKQIPYKTHSHP